MTRSTDARNTAVSSDAFELTERKRGLFGVIGALFGLLVLLILIFNPRYQPLPELLLGVLAIGGIVFIGLAALGRVPTSFEGGGVSVKFTSEVSNIIGTVKSSVPDGEVQSELLRSLRNVFGPEVFTKAETSVEGSGAEDLHDESAAPASDDGGRDDSRYESAAGMGDNHGDLSEILKRAKGVDFVESEFVVENAGKGAPPKFDFAVKFKGALIAIECEKYWNDSTVGLVARKIDRSLRKGTPVDGVIVICPRAGVRKYSTQIENSPAIAVMANEDVDAVRLSDQLESISLRLSNGRALN